METQSVDTSPKPRRSHDGRIADNIVHFARTLRKAGMRVGPASVRDAIEAVLAAGIGTRDDFYWTLHAVLVKRHEDHPVFDEAFRLYWRSRELIEKMLQMFSPMAADMREREKPRAGEKRVQNAFMEGQQQNQRQRDLPPEIEIDARLSWSSNEVFRDMDFAQMSAAEIAQARRSLRALVLPFDEARTRRFRVDQRGRRMDQRAMMRHSLKSGGELILPRYKAVRTVLPPLVVLADISGSMSQYTRIFLHFLHALSEKRQRLNVFVFGTRLTNITRQLRDRDPDEALAGCASAVKDWSGGTRIAEALHRFNRDWSRRVLGQGAVVLLITDGLERDDINQLGAEMERLHKSCRKLIWLNPLLRFEGFEAKARGVRAMLPHVDEFRPVHSLNSLSELCEALAQGRRNDPEYDPRRWLARS